MDAEGQPVRLEQRSGEVEEHHDLQLIPQSDLMLALQLSPLNSKDQTVAWLGTAKVPQLPELVLRVLCAQLKVQHLRSEVKWIMINMPVASGENRDRQPKVVVKGTNMKQYLSKCEK